MPYIFYNKFLKIPLLTPLACSTGELPKDAPNYKTIPKTHDTETGESNKTYTPRHTSKPRDKAIDKKIIKRLKKYEKNKV